MNFNRRNFLRRTTMLSAGLAATQAANAQTKPAAQDHSQHQHPAPAAKPAEQKKAD